MGCWRAAPWRHLLWGRDLLTEAWLAIALAALLGGALVYAYAVAALLSHARLASLAPPRSLAGALWRGAWMPACGCTALAHARRLAPPHRAPFLVAAYALNPLLVVAALLVGGVFAAVGVVVVALAAALAATRIPSTEKPRTRLDDLLLRKDAMPLRDAAPYVATYGAPGIALGALVGAASVGPAWAGGIAVAALALLFTPPMRDVAEDHGAAFASRVRWTLVAFAFAAGLAVSLA